MSFGLYLTGFVVLLVGYSLGNALGSEHVRGMARATGNHT
jgi:hypothetical protein